MKKSVSPKKVKNRDVSGMTGQAIIKAILGGERDPQKLADFRDARVKASKEEIARSLEGHWQEDLLFVLRQEQNAYEFCQKQMAECDQRIEQYLQQREDRAQEPVYRKRSGRSGSARKKGKYATVRSTHGVVSHGRSGPDPDRRG